VGHSPMAATLVDLAAVLGWRSELVSPSEFKAGTVSAHSIVVVATQGHDDEDTIEHAVKSEPAFVGLVASEKRGTAVLGYLADKGLEPGHLEKVKFPVGLDLGHTSHNEIAVAVLGELVALKAAGELAVANYAQETTEPETAIDPVCGMTVKADESSRPYEFEGTTYYFCATGCRSAFERDPHAYIKEEVA